jgi:3-deoxy-D-manno-octulosonate 8-phosphate phosphatase (KDO 8-P phosphatase)
MNKIKLVCLDLDGTITDGIFTMSSEGTLSKAFFTRDFYGIEQLLRNGIKVVIMTGSHDNVIENQINRICSHSEFWNKCFEEDLTLRLVTGVNYKIDVMVALATDKDFFEHPVEFNSIAYMGDAENDLECLKVVGYPGCPHDAILDVKKVSRFISNFNGGKGAVHEFCFNILQKNKNLENGEKNANIKT